MSGKSFDEWQLGERIDHPVHHLVTEEDNRLFTTMTHNPHPPHGAETARAGEPGHIMVHGTFTFSLMIGIAVAETTLGVLVANVGYEKLVMPRPVFIGDTLRVETEVAALRPSRSRPGDGIVTFSHAAINQRDETVCACLHMALLHGRYR